MTQSRKPSHTELRAPTRVLLEATKFVITSCAATEHTGHAAPPHPTPTAHTQIISENQSAHCLEPRSSHVGKLEACVSQSPSDQIDCFHYGG